MRAKTRKLLPLAFTCAIAALVAVPALAAPDKTGTLNADTRQFTWNGGPKSGAAEPSGVIGSHCGDPNFPCEYILLKLEVNGDLEVTIVPDAPADLDLRLYRSNDAGQPQGAEVKSSANLPTVQTETLKAVALPAGNYVAVVEFFAATQATYKGTAKLTPGTPPPAGTAQATATPTQTAAPSATTTATPTPTPGADRIFLASPTPQPTAQPAKKKAKKKTKKKQTKRQKCLAKAKKIKQAKKRKAATKRCKAKKKKGKARKPR